MKRKRSLINMHANMYKWKLSWYEQSDRNQDLLLLLLTPQKVHYDGYGAGIL